MSQPSFSRAPGSQFQPTPPRNGLSSASPSTLFPSNLDPFAPSTSPGAISPSTSPVDFRTTFSGGAHSPALSPGTGRTTPAFAQPSFGILDNARPYPLVERRSFRDASSAGDVVVSREELRAHGNNHGSAGAGAIGDSRRSITPSPSPSPLPGAAAAEDDELAAALNLPAGILDSLGPPRDSADATSRPNSRPSSFILDVLPQSRERTSGANTPSLSLDSVSSAAPAANASTADAAFLHSPNSLAPGAPHHAAAQFFQNPNLASSTTSLVSNGGGSAGLHAFSASRTSSPGPLDLLNNSNYGSVVRSSSSSFESLSTKVNSLESTVSDLSNLLAIEFKGLREEVNFLRTLVYQQQQQQQQHHHQRRPAFEHRQSHERETDSPLLTLRSPSPHHQSPAFPQPIPLSRGNSYQGAGSGGSNHANSTLLAASTSPLISPHSHSVPSNYFKSSTVATSSAAGAGGGQLNQYPLQQHQWEGDDAAAKDKQIELLTHQVNSLTSTVSSLLSSSGHGLHGSSGGNPVRQAAKADRAAAAASAGGGGGGGPVSNGMSSRQLSLPVSMSSAASIGIDNGWKRGEGVSATASGLGVTTPGGSLLLGGGGGGANNASGKGGPGLRTVSQGGLGRSSSLRSSSASQLPGGGGNSSGGLRIEQGVSSSPEFWHRLLCRLTAHLPWRLVPVFRCVVESVSVGRRHVIAHAWSRSSERGQLAHARRQWSSSRLDREPSRLAREQVGAARDRKRSLPCDREIRVSSFPPLSCLPLYISPSTVPGRADSDLRPRFRASRSRVSCGAKTWSPKLRRSRSGSSPT